MKCLRLLALSFLCLIPTLAQDARVLEEKIKEANAHLYDQKYEPALALFDEVLKADPDNIQAFLGKMNTLGSMRKPQEVQKMAVDKGKGQTTESLIIDANNKIWNRDMAGALASLTQAQAKKGNASYMVDYLTGYIHYRSRQLDQAIPFLEAAIQKNKDYPEAYYLLGDIYLKKKDTNKVLKYWNDYLKLIPKVGARYAYVNSTLQKMGGN